MGESHKIEVKVTQGSVALVERLLPALKVGQSAARWANKPFIRRVSRIRRIPGLKHGKWWLLKAIVQRRSHPPHYVRQRFGIADPIQVVRVNDQHRRIVILGEKSPVGPTQVGDVIATHSTLVGPVARSDAVHQRVHLGPQVDDEVWQRDLLGQHMVDAPVHLQLIARQIQMGKETVFGETIIADES